MPRYSRASLDKLATCDHNLQRLFTEVIRHWDCTIIYGHRTPEEQQALYAQGRTKPGSIVTYKDGVTKLSAHNQEPSLAIDVVPYPIDWADEERMVYFAGFVMGMAQMMAIPLKWGGDWNRNQETSDENFRDLPHFELR